MREEIGRNLKKLFVFLEIWSHVESLTLPAQLASVKKYSNTVATHILHLINLVHKE